MHIQRRKILRAAVLAAATAALLAAGAARAQEEERPRIFLEKRIFADSSGGKKSFYEVHTVAHGENLWKILNRRGVLPPAEYVRMLREFQRANPEVADVRKLKAGQKVLVPTAVPPDRDPRVGEGKVVPHLVAAGDTLTRLLTARGVSRRDLPRYLAAIKEINESIRDVNRIMAGSTILLPSGQYFEKELATALGPPKEVTPAQQVALTRDTPTKPPEEAPKGPPPPTALAKEVPTVPQVALAKEAPPVAKATEIKPPPPAAMAKEVPPVPPATVTREVPPAALAKEVPSVPPAATAKEVPQVPPVLLTKEVSPVPVMAVDAPARPDAQLLPPPPAQAVAPVIEVRPGPAKTEAPKKEEPALPPPKPPYRGLLTDLLAGLGERWADRGTLYLPVPSGGEVVLSLEDFPVARFSNGNQVLIDFRGALPENIRGLIMETWKNYRVISMDGTRDPWEIIRRLLQASGYHSVKEGLARPLVVGEGVAVTLPARWIVLRTPESLLSGEVILIKEVPENPSGNLIAVLRFADRVGIRVLPIATDRNALEGFLVGIDDPGATGDPPARRATPSGGLAALDFALDFLGITKKEGERLRIGGKGDAFQLIVQPERVFEAGGKQYVTDTGRMAPALRTLLRDSGYRVFPVMKKDSGRDIFERVLKESGISSEARLDYPVSGGGKEGYSVSVTGTRITSKEWLEARKAREAVLFGGRTHSATRALMRDIGVDIVEW
jgi:hypothetical protein